MAAHVHNHPPLLHVHIAASTPSLYVLSTCSVRALSLTPVTPYSYSIMDCFQDFPVWKAGRQTLARRLLFLLKRIRSDCYVKYTLLIVCTLRQTRGWTQKMTTPIDRLFPSPSSRAENGLNGCARRLPMPQAGPEATMELVCCA